MKKILSLFRNRQPSGNSVIIVSGLPRSGTSLMMQILEAGGVDYLTDQIRTPDDDNPKGYYEFERVKALKTGDAGWLDGAQGKAVKVISALLEHLPNNYTYKVIFMRRDMEEVLASQKAMLIRRGEPTDRASDELMAKMFEKHLAEVTSWMARQPNIEVLYVDYNELMANPEGNIDRVAGFLGLPLDLEAMNAAPDKRLYRRKS